MLPWCKLKILEYKKCVTYVRKVSKLLGEIIYLHFTFLTQDSNKVSNSLIMNVSSDESKQGAQSKGARKSAEKSQKKVLSESQPQSKLGERIVSMLQKPGKSSEQSTSSHVAGRSEKEAAVSNSAKPSARGDKRWLAPYTEIAITSRYEGYR